MKTKYWFLIVTPDFEADGRPFSVQVESSEDIEGVKNAVKQKFVMHSCPGRCPQARCVEDKKAKRFSM